MTELNITKSFVKNFFSEKISEQDVEDFRQRVFSFIEGQKWVSRPLVLSPSICARYGWKCINPNLLECVACGAKLCTQEPKIESYDAYKSCLDKIVTDLKDGHKSHCPWPLAPSPESFVKIVPLPKEEALSQFVNRLKPCLEFKSSIPQVEESVISELGLKQDDVLSLCKIVEMSPADADLIGTSAVCFAAIGWTLFSINNEKLYVKCDSCQRLSWTKSFNLVNISSTNSTNTENGTNSSLGSSPTSKNGTNSENGSSKLENVTNSRKECSMIENSTNDQEESFSKRRLENSTSDATPRKRLKLDRRDFNPVEEHRPWCRWVTITDAKKLSPLKDEDKNENYTSLPGWKIYLKNLLRNIPSPKDNSSETTPSKEYVRNVRNLLESWSSPISLLEHQ